MKLTFRTFNCGMGDCIFLILKKEDASYHIMVDCGSLKDDILSFVRNDLQERIDLLVVTHIDNDHIAGLSTMLEKLPDLKIGKILFNCYHREQIGEQKSLSEKQNEVFEELKHRLPLKEVEATGKASAREAIGLSATILKDERWAAAWGRKLTVAGDEIELDGGYGKIKILSPRQEDLEELENQFKKEFWMKFYQDYTQQFVKEEEIYEVLLRIWETTLTEERTAKVAYTKPTGESFVKAADEMVKPVTLPNRCSIAFVYEYEGHRILVLGDADPNLVADEINATFAEDKPVMMDLIKVSHHGSAHSTTKELIQAADSAHYYFTGGNKEERPSLETLSRIITAGLHGQEKRTLHFNRKNKVVKDVMTLPELVDYPCEIDLENNPYEIEI